MLTFKTIPSGIRPLLSVLQLLPIVACSPQKPPISQSRQGDASFHDIATQYHDEHPEIADSSSAFSHALSLATLGEIPVPEISAQELAQGFVHIRDHRFLRSSDSPEFPRRESWLYPDDGCYSRAALAGRQLSEARLPRPAKVFIFGDLSAHTPNSPDGIVHWWFHVAPLYSVAVPADRTGLSGSHLENWYVMDPTLEPFRPLRLMEWVARQTEDPSSVRIAVCDPHTYRPEDPCDEAPLSAEANSESDEEYFLVQEWSRQLELGRDPTLVLGTQPPWITRI